MLHAPPESAGHIWNLRRKWQRHPSLGSTGWYLEKANDSQRWPRPASPQAGTDQPRRSRQVGVQVLCDSQVVCSLALARPLNKTQVTSTTCDAAFSKRDSMLMCGAAGLRRMMIMKKLIALSVFMLTVFGSISGPAIAADIRSERGAPGWDGPQDPSPPWAPPG